MSDYGEVESNDDLQGAGGTEDHTNLDNLSTHHTLGKYSNTKPGNQMLNTMSNRSALGNAYRAQRTNDE